MHLQIAYTDSVTKGIAQNSSMTSTLLSMRTLFETKQFKSPAPSPARARPVESMLAQSNRLEETIGASGEQVGAVIEVPSATAHLTVPTSTVLTVNDMQYHPGSQPGAPPHGSAPHSVQSPTLFSLSQCPICHTVQSLTRLSLSQCSVCHTAQSLTRLSLSQYSVSCCWCW